MFDGHLDYLAESRWEVSYGQSTGVLRIGAGVMNSEQELAATIAHELRHSRAFMGSGSNSEAAAEAVEQALREYIQGLR